MPEHLRRRSVGEAPEEMPTAECLQARDPKRRK